MKAALKALERALILERTELALANALKELMHKWDPPDVERGPEPSSFVKGGEKSGRVAEQKCTSRSSVFSENVRLRRVSSGALSRSEVGGAYASGESLAERVVTAGRLCLRR